MDSIKRSVDANFEIIVITSDSNLALTGIKDCFVLHSETMPSEKRNIGSRVANGYYLAFFDDDVEIEEDCLYNLYETIKQTNAGMVYGKLFKADEPSRLDEAGGYLTSSGFIWSRAGQNIVDKGQFEKVEKIFAGKSASCIVRADLFNEVGGFDEDFGILGEESDLSWRIWLQNRPVYFDPSAKGIHYFNTKFKPPKKYYTSERVHYNGCRNYITMLMKNLEVKNLWRILPLHILAWVTAGCLMFLTGKFRQSINIFRGLFYPIRNLSLILEKRRKVQDKRVVTDEQLWPYIFRRPPKGYYTKRFLRYLSIGLHG